MVQPKKEKKRIPREQNKRKSKANAQKRTSRGRQKIEIKRIENDSNRKVTLSKRRQGLFNKGAEICILTGAELAIITRAENGKFSTFGHPNMDDVIDRYLNRPNSEAAPSLPAQINDELVDENKRLSSELEAEKKKLNAQKKADVVNNFWWNEPMDNLGLEELQQCLDSLIDLRNNVLALSSAGVAADDKARELALFNDQYHSQSMGVSDNVGMELATKADELELSDYFDLDKSMLANELLNDSQGVLNNDFQQTVASALNDFCSSQDYQSFCSMDSYGSDFSYFY